MSRSTLFAGVQRALEIAHLCEARRLPTQVGIELVRSAEEEERKRRQSRRDWLKAVGQAGLAGAVVSVATPIERLFAARARDSPLDVGIVGAGLAGLACADALADGGVVATVYDAASRTGGRCWSLRGFFPGQVAERGGEFIDTPHKTLLRYARRFSLALEDVTKKAGETVYYFGGAHIPEAVIVDEFREFVSIMRADLRRLSREITALSHTAYDVVLDQTSLAAYLEGGNSAGAAAGTIAKAAISEAYLAEYGLEPDEQSCLNFLMFIHADRRSKFTPFGISSDERYHLVDGNDGIAEGLTQSLSQVVQLEMRLVAVRRRANGAIELTFDTPSGPVVRAHDVVVLAIPFTILRTVALDVSLSVPAAQRSAINLLGYGTNAKMMLGFGGRPWVAQGSSGTAYSDLTNHQLTWETNRARASAARGVLTDYSSGDRGQSLNQGTVQGQAAAFLADLDVVFPGAAAVASRRADGTLVAHLEHWPSNPLTLGSYTCYRPGQFTSIAGLEGLAVDNLHFAGEHTNSFYVWQGFMEGAALSGLDVAAAILRVAKQS